MPTTTRCQFQFQFDGNCPAQSPNYVENFSLAQFVEFNYTLDSHNLLSTYSQWPTVYVCCFSFNWGRFRYLPTSLALSRRCSAPVNNGTAELGTAHSSIISLGDDNHPASSLSFILCCHTGRTNSNGGWTNLRKGLTTITIEQVVHLFPAVNITSS